jgi:hypothetical protein
MGFFAGIGVASIWKDGFENRLKSGVVALFHRVNFAPQFFVRRKHLRQAHKPIHATPELKAGSSRQIRIGMMI